MRNMIDILLAVLLLCPFYSCDDVKEYPWNDAWDQTEQETPEDSENTDSTEEPSDPETPVDSEEPETPQEPETPEEPVEPEEPETPVEPEEPETPVEPETPHQPGEPLTLEWTDVSDSFGTLPSYITVKKSTSAISGKKTLIYVAEADLAQAQWDVWSVKAGEDYKTSDSYKTPSEIYNEQNSVVVINGGYFYYEGGAYTSSLAVSDSELLAYNINYASEDWKTVYYPTRAAFVETEDGSLDACWTYMSWAGHWMYPSPADNSWSKKPQTQPNADFPAGAKEFAAVTAIGGGPVLIDKGEYINSYIPELFDGSGGVNPTANNPRTAIGVTADRKMMFFVCEGREMTVGVAGLTTAEVAGVLMGLGCVEAINLDGGGSSCMLVNGQETIKVSDGSQRAVASTVMLK